MKIYPNESKTSGKHSIKRLLPNLFKKPFSVLYIGARTNRFLYGKEFKEAKSKISVLEVFKPNVNYLRTLPWLKEVIHADVTKFKTNQRYDIIFWWQGPEHIPKELIPETLIRLERYGKKFIILSCPWGHHVQGKLHGNPFEVHLSHNDPEFFEKLGYEVECMGKKNERGSSIVGKKVLENFKTLPWLPEQAINYIDRLLTENSKVFESGSGGSTIWFAERTKHLITVEDNKDFLQRLRKKLNYFFDLFPVQSYCVLDNWKSVVKNNIFDVIIIDGRNRVKMVENMLPHLNTGGILVLDNSEREKYKKIHYLLRNYNKIEFKQKKADQYGFVYKNWTTTIWKK